MSSHQGRQSGASPDPGKKNRVFSCILLVTLCLAIAAFVFLPGIFGLFAWAPVNGGLSHTSKPPIHTPASQYDQNTQLIISTPAPPLPTPTKTTTIVVENADNAFVPSPVLLLGMQDEFVLLLQTRLMELGYFDSDITSTYYGPATQSAVKLFQRVQGIAQTGEADGFIQALILDENVIPYHMKQGDEGTDIEALQFRLNELGYFKQKQSGYFGSDTQQAVLRYQKRNKLKETGVMDLESINLLYSFNARYLVDPTPKPTAKPAGSYKGVDGLIAIAKEQAGKPYVWGGNGPKSFDCSGFLHYCLVQVNRDVGRVKAIHYSQFGDWQEITQLKDCKKGDFLFFRSDTDASVNHTGIYLGNNEFIHASFSAGKVTIERVSSYFQRNFVNARRLFA